MGESFFSSFQLIVCVSCRCHFSLSAVCFYFIFLFSFFSLVSNGRCWNFYYVSRWKWAMVWPIAIAQCGSFSSQSVGALLIWYDLIWVGSRVVTLTRIMHQAHWRWILMQILIDAARPYHAARAWIDWLATGQHTRYTESAFKSSTFVFTCLWYHCERREELKAN